MTTATTASVTSSTVRTFLLPDLGEGLTEGELVRWLVAVGDQIVVDQPVAEVETAKSVVEVPSPFGGVVATLHGDAGAVIDVGSPLISVDEGADAASAASTTAVPGTATVGAERALSYREEERAGATPPAEVTPDTAGGDAADQAQSGSGNVLIGYGTSGTTARGRTRRPRGSGSAVSSAAPTPVSGAAPAQTPPVGSDVRRAPAVISPIVRRLARDLGVTLDTVNGTGKDGLILRRDVEAAVGVGTGTATTTAEAGASLGESPAPSSPGSAEAGATAGELDRRSGLPITARTEMRGVRKVTAEAMSRSRREIPEATVWVDVDATRLLKLRERLKAADPAGAPGLLALIGRFTAAALMRYPELNARIDGEHIVTVDGVNLGFAAQTDRGLVVPSVPNAHRLNARELDAELKALTARARDGKCTPEELRRGTFTLNNYGVFGVDGSAAIINHPEVGILGVGRIIEKPWVVKGRLRVRRVTQLTLAFDHRVCDGGTASAFLMFIARAIEDPTSVLAEL
ncbi:dihydrolipoamide acetyltransferase component of pyruvate dehydrogenase complex [Tersicoccus solisilvae]|uniref:Dihydrolipoamide acetyltransferase component of pyruvate dehydrogenase complex n=1 Tax=Tersicoccus solisilvae TaxID=1882339 RepID=A0ABQ1NPB8_9MICC|nr:dihydrolipoamide acetyltransferase family protein [Tersicoccus solisilvae]GGC81960.1 dihydrolipoamide acetyltransferase component of pyruvate dehydrogenase complex [Tersicoccus solisilvae]